MSDQTYNRDAVINTLNQILQIELSGVVRYTHYSLMVFGYNRIPIVSWLRSQANECLAHAHTAGEMITHLGEHPALTIGPLLETHKHDVGDILRESMETEKAAKALYTELLNLVRDRDVFLEEYARGMIAKEEEHLGTVNKMLRKPGDIAAFDLDH